MGEKIEDFGEKIGGAKKDLWKDRNLSLEDIKDMSHRELFKYVTKDNLWKKPDYKVLVENGLDKETAYLMKKIRDSYAVSVKPSNDIERDKKLIENYIKFTEELRDKVDSIKTTSDFKNLFNDLFEKNGYYEKSFYSGSWTDKGRELKFITNKFLKSVQISDYDIIKAKREIEKSGFPEKQGGWRKNINIVKRNDEYLIVKKNGYANNILADGFKTQEEAEKYLEENLKPKLKEKNKTFKLVRPQLSHITRTGEEYRNGKDITTEEFMNTFGFRGGEFGNWTNNLDRQQSLNMAYDALMDLSKTLNINPKDISLGGELGIAFGARGSGNALAHYEPSKIVINLTKMKGAGSLAHEWAHALDDYFGRLSGDRTIDSPYASSGINKKKSKLSEKSIEAWKNIMNTLNKREKTPEEIKEDLNKDINRLKKNMSTWLDPIKSNLEKEQNYGSRIKRAATREELNEVEKLIDKIINGNNRSEDLDKLNNKFKDIKEIMINKENRENIQNYIYWINQYENDLKNIGSIKRVDESYFLKNALELDKGKSKPYYSNRQEMFARAFESYVQDKINKGGCSSDYLVYGTNVSFDEYKPYPLGDERKAFFNAFEQFTNDLQELHKIEVIDKTELKDRKTLEDYAEEYNKEFKEVKDRIDGLDAFKAENSSGEYVTVSPSTKEISKLQITYYNNDEPISDGQLDKIEEAADRMVLGGYTNITEEIKYEVKQKGSIAYEELKKLPGKDFVIRTTEEKLDKLKELSIDYSVIQSKDSCKVIVKESDKNKVLEALELRNKEVGNIEYSKIKNDPNKNYISMSIDEFERLKSSEIEFAAFEKGENINVVVKQCDAKEVFKSIGRKYEEQIGNISYSEIKNSPGQITFRSYTGEQLQMLNKSGIKYAAFDKGNGNYNVAFKQNDLEKVRSIVKKTKDVIVK